MCKILYTLKTVLLSERSKEPPMSEFLNSDVLCKLKRFVNFCVKIYIPWWIACTSASSAPRRDLMLMKELLQYKEIDNGTSESALKAISRHLWYLCEELVPLSLLMMS